VLPAIVLTRFIYGRIILAAVPGWVLEHSATHIVTATLPGTQVRWVAGPRARVLASIAGGHAQTEERLWEAGHVVWLTRFGAAHALGHFWDSQGRFSGYYINLQAPLRRSMLGFDSRDHELDVLVGSDGTWRWKDEAELDQAVKLGLFSSEEAAAIRAEGEGVIRRLPRLLPTGWEGWRPDPAWPPLRLPGGWDRL
jgi:Protein of unknown function (DUF402)